MRSPYTALLLAIVAASSCSPSQPQQETLRFTAIPDDSKSGLRIRFEPIAERLSEALGAPVEYLPTSDYQASVEAFKNGDVQLAWFGGLTGAQARSAVPGARAIAQGRSDPEFRTYFIANPSAGIQQSVDFPAELRGHSFTFGSSSSTSGRLMPEHFIRKHAQTSPAEFFGAQNHYSGSHDKTAKLVEAGTFDAGAINYKTYERMIAEGSLDKARCAVIWVTPPYPDYNWTAHPSIDETFGAGAVDRLQDSLTSLSDEAILSSLDRAEGFIPATNEDFQTIADLAHELGFLR